MISLRAGGYRLEVNPRRGGSIVQFDWLGQPVMRPASGDSILDVSCFPLVPFSNRIANGRFAAQDREVRLTPNFPGASHPHPLHGFGWLAPWKTIGVQETACELEHTYQAGEWPWSYVARQTFSLDNRGLTIGLALENLHFSPMPAGLGFHPYFPRDADTIYEGLHCGEWSNQADCLPLRLDLRSTAIDWWAGQPVASRSVDTVYTGRSGLLKITWPSRGISLKIQPSAELDHTVVFTPEDAGFFCIEPVSHATNAVNLQDAMRWLAPHEVFTASVRFEASKE